MKKFLIIMILSGIAGFLASCDRDECPAHGEAPAIHQSNNA
jgi:hypothetical protein